MINQSTNKLLRIKDVVNLTGLSKSYIYQLTEQNKFPKQIRLIDGGTSVAWLEREVQAWIEHRIATRNSNR
ncbi:MAG: AlpA family transcriptional regulator [Alteromonadaceae bacterium]|nr:AlpA family transcriptional regulator [Alteromonadaceae bacterium]